MLTKFCRTKITELPYKRKYDEFLYNLSIQDSQNKYGQHPQAKKGQNEAPTDNTKIHPHSHYFDVISFSPITPIELFNKLISQERLDRPDISSYELQFQDSDDFSKIENELLSQHRINQQSAQKGFNELKISKTVKKHIRIEKDKRTTISETITVDGQGKQNCELKEEIEDEKGLKLIRYLDDLPKEEKDLLQSNPNKNSNKVQESNIDGSIQRNAFKIQNEKTPSFEHSHDRGIIKNVGKMENESKSHDQAFYKKKNPIVMSHFDNK
jgi:hypothetical protein